MTKFIFLGDLCVLCGSDFLHAVTELADLTLAAALEGLRRRRFSAWELTQACLERIAALQPLLNCFIGIDAGGALKAAAAADAKIEIGAPSESLLGAPLAHKDIFARTGMALTCGSRIYDAPQATTATVLERLDAAGAIDLGSLHCAEFAAGATGHNGHLGPCRNPWDPTRMAGGSSSGSAAAVAARLVFGALGTDTGGSVRMPAALCGVVGLRPTLGRVSLHGVFPRAFSSDTVGPLARTCEDAALMLQAIAGADTKDSRTELVAVPDYRSALTEPIRGLKIGVPRNFFFDDIDSGIAPPIEECFAAFRKLGAEIVALEIPEPQRVFDLAQLVARVEAAAIHRRWLVERPGDYDQGVREPMEAGLFVPAVHYIAALDERAPLLRAYLDGPMSDADVLATPVLEIATPTLEACRPDQPGFAARQFQIFGRQTRPFSYLGLPALSLPCGFQPDGMPVGLQLIGRPFAEAQLLNVGHIYQQATDWHTRAPAPRAAVAAAS